MKRAIKDFFVLLIVFLIMPGALAADKTSKPEIKTVDNYIAVFDFEVTTGDKGISRPLTESARREIVLSGKYDVIDRGNMNKILGEQKFQLTGCVAQECIVDAGQLLGVGKIISGTVSIVGKTYYLTLSLISVKTGKIENIAEDTCRCEVDELLGSTKRLAKKLLGEKVEQPPEAIAKAKAEEERVKAEQLAKAKAEEERIKAEKAARVKAEEERIKAEQLAKAKAEEERIKAEKVARARAEEERIKAEKAARVKAEEEKIKAEQAARAKAEKAAKTEAEEIAKAETKQNGLKPTTASIDPSAVNSQIAASDGRFEKLASGVVRDTQSGLEWYAGPDKNTVWDDAKSWAANLRVDGGGWRMPTSEELKILYRKGVGSRNMTPLLETTGWVVWSGETVTEIGRGGSLTVLALDYGDGRELLDRRDNSNFKRGFAVRSRK